MAAKKKFKASKSKRQQPAEKEIAKPHPVKRGSVKSLIPGKWQVHVLIFLLLVISTLILYSSDLHLGFFRIDDKQYVETNPWIQSISMENISYILTQPYFANYSPVHLFSYMLDYAVWGPGAYGFHLSSNIWAGFVAGFVYLISLALTQRQIVAIGAAVLFVVHPVHVETIVWISSRKDIIAAAFILPSFLAYLQYRHVKSANKWWYILSLILFLFAVAGKLSVATFPAVLFSYDIFIKKRKFIRSLIDQIPFLVIAIIFSFAVAGAQPKTGLEIDFTVISKAFAQSLWTLSGFATYVIYRVPPEPGGALTGIIGFIAILAIFLLPLFLRRRFPLAVVCIFWILFAYLPTQVLSFAYPVTDRYLFLPSVAIVILVAWSIYELAKWAGKWKLPAAVFIFSIITFFWLKTSLNYLAEWNDPRSVWHGAIQKSTDVQVFYNMGWHYMDKAASFGSKRRKEVSSVEDAKEFASIVWKDNPQLPALLNELNSGQHNGPLEDIFKKDLQTTALHFFDEAVFRKGKHMMGDLFFHRGMLFLDMGDLEGAKREFLTGIEVASRLEFAESREEVLVNCHYNLGIVEWTLTNYEQALHWIRIAEEQQIRSGVNWFPELTANRKRLEQIIASLQPR